MVYKSGNRLARSNRQKCKLHKERFLVRENDVFADVFLSMGSDGMRRGYVETRRAFCTIIHAQ